MSALSFVGVLLKFLVSSTAANFLGVQLTYFKLPLITGYLLGGVICGPYVLNLVEKESLDQLNFINNFALAVIAFCAGAELYFPEIRNLFRKIMYQMLG